LLIPDGLARSCVVDAYPAWLDRDFPDPRVRLNRLNAALLEFPAHQGSGLPSRPTHGMPSVATVL